MNPAAFGQMGMGGPMGPAGAKKKKEGPVIPKLIQNDKNSKLYKCINYGYKLVYIVGSFAKKLLWFGSCIAFMYLMPMSFEIFAE
jgi:hypothetical protein